MYFKLLTVLIVSYSVVLAFGSDEGYFWQITDFHLDLNYSTSGDALDMCHLAGNGDNKLGYYGDYHCDSPWSLVVSSIDAMSAIMNNIDFILWTGDTTPHVPDSTMNLKKIFAGMFNVTNYFAERFPHTAVFPVLGNHDSFPSNQMPIHNRNYYDGVWQSVGWYKILPESAQNTFVKGGYYAVFINSGLLLVVLNTNLYFVMDKLTALDPDPVGQFEWLQFMLESCRVMDCKVILTAHVPPGAFPRTSGITWMHPQHNARFLSITRSYNDVITSQVFGHEHSDSFRLFQDEGSTVGVGFMAPAVTPWNTTLPGAGYNNPGIRLYRYNKTTGHILNFKQYFLNLTKANIEKQAVWELEYDFAETYDMPDLTTRSFDALYAKLRNMSLPYFSRYLKYSSVSVREKEECPKKCYLGHMCAMAYPDLDAYHLCLQQ